MMYKIKKKTAAFLALFMLLIFTSCGVNKDIAASNTSNPTTDLTSSAALSSAAFSTSSDPAASVTSSREISTAPNKTTASKAAVSKKGSASSVSNSKATSSKQKTTSSKAQKDKYGTDPIPSGKPTPKEPQNETVDRKTVLHCTFSISCKTILNNMDKCDKSKKAIVPKNGVILKATRVSFYKGESVFDILRRVCKENGIHMEFSNTPMYHSAYIEGIANLYEFDVGSGSGWMYKVNDWFPNYGCSRYQIKDNDLIQWVYTCDLGEDVGGGVQQK